METIEVLESLVERMENPANHYPGVGAMDFNPAADGGACWCLGGHLGRAMGEIPLDNADPEWPSWHGSDAPAKLADALVAEGADRDFLPRRTIYQANINLDHATLLAACKRAVRTEKAKAGISIKIPHKRTQDLTKQEEPA